MFDEHALPAMTSTVKTSSTWVDATRRWNRKLGDARVLRQAGIHTYRSLVALNRWLPPPRMLVNGHSKSGTHLVADGVALLPQTMFSGRHFTMGDFVEGDQPWLVAFPTAAQPPIADERLRRFLSRCPQGMFVTAHARHSDSFETLLTDLGFRHVLILRDPRDLVVSHVKFVMRQRSHFNHRYFAHVLSTDDERLMAVIRGFTPAPGDGLPAPSIGDSYAGYLPWRDAAGTLVTRFETLVGAGGGGDQQRAGDEMRRIGAFLGRPLTEAAATAIATGMYSRSGLTYRKGVVGDWTNHFTDEHRAAFKEVAGSLLIELGYERDLDW